jgi:predicted transposase YdaD
VEELVQFIRGVKTVDEQEGLLHELLKRVRDFSDLSQLQNLIITIQNTQKGTSVSKQTLEYNFATHDITLTT